MAQQAYDWPDRENFALQFAAPQAFVGSGIYGPGFNTAAPGYVPFNTVAAGVAPGHTCRAFLIGGKRRAIRISSPAVPS